MTRAVLTDIEGTTSSLSFVKDVLFPYSRTRLPDFVREHAHDPQVSRLLEDVRKEAGATLGQDDVIKLLLRWIDEDRKATALKALQGLIWEKGYRDGDFTGHIYADAVEGLRAWHKRGIRLAVFSSGSVKAQQLLFRHSDAGDLTPLFTAYFDTTIGQKREADAYHRIADSMKMPASEILFLSDIKEELDAARQAGMRTHWLQRDATTASAIHPVAKNFREISI